MMTMKLRVIIDICIILMLVAVVLQTKKRRLELKYAITWILVPIILAIIVAIPGALEWIANGMGIYNVVNMVFFLGFIFSLIVIYTLTMALSAHSDRIRSLAQMIALDEHDKRSK